MRDRISSLLSLTISQDKNVVKCNSTLRIAIKLNKMKTLKLTVSDEAYSWLENEIMQSLKLRDDIAFEIERYARIILERAFEEWTLEKNHDKGHLTSVDSCRYCDIELEILLRISNDVESAFNEEERLLFKEAIDKFQSLLHDLLPKYPTQLTENEVEFITKLGQPKPS